MGCHWDLILAALVATTLPGPLGSFPVMPVTSRTAARRLSMVDMAGGAWILARAARKAVASSGVMGRLNWAAACLAVSPALTASMATFCWAAFTYPISSR